MRRVPATTWAIVCLLGILWFSAGIRIAPNAKSHDFLNFYTGATLAREGSISRLHVVEEQLAVERRHYPDIPGLVPFVRPPYYAVLLSPLAFWPLDTAFHVWIAGQIVVLALICWWGVRRFGPDALILGAMFYPTAIGIANGQDCALMLALVVLAFITMERGHRSLAGALFALTLVKFHLLILVPITAAVRKQWRFLAGYAAMAVAALAASVLLSGVDGLIQYAQLLTNKNLERLSPSEELMVNLNALALNFGTNSKFVPAALSAVIGIAVVLAFRRGTTWRWFAGAIAGSLLIAPHVYGYDVALLLLPLWFSVFDAPSRGERIIAVALCTPIPFMFGMAGRPWALIAPAAVLSYVIASAVENRREQRILCRNLHTGLQSTDGRSVTRADEGVAAQNSHAPQGTR
jgi:hypothetical protein